MSNCMHADATMPAAIFVHNQICDRPTVLQVTALGTQTLSRSLKRGRTWGVKHGVDRSHSGQRSSSSCKGKIPSRCRLVIDRKRECSKFLPPTKRLPYIPWLSSRDALPSCTSLILLPFLRVDHSERFSLSNMLAEIISPPLYGLRVWAILAFAVARA